MSKNTTATMVTMIAVLTLGAALPVVGQDPDPGQVRIAFVTPAQPDWPWGVVENGARQAAADLGTDVALEYRAVASTVRARLAQGIDAAVASRPDAIAVSLPDADSVLRAIEAAVATGIPVVAVGSGRDVIGRLGLHAQVGVDESVAGTAAGRRLGELGVRHAICLTVDSGDPWDTRCRSAVAGLAESGGTMDLLVALDPAGDPVGPRAALAARLQADDTIDAVITASAGSVAQALQAIDDADASARVRLATFDLGPDALDALEAGDMILAVDQQPFLQGYLAVMTLALHEQSLLTPGGGRPILTGPSFVTQADAAVVRTLMDQGVR